MKTSLKVVIGVLLTLLVGLGLNWLNSMFPLVLPSLLARMPHVTWTQIIRISKIVSFIVLPVFLIYIFRKQCLSILAWTTFKLYYGIMWVFAEMNHRFSAWKERRRKKKRARSINKIRVANFNKAEADKLFKEERDKKQRAQVKKLERDARLVIVRKRRRVRLMLIARFFKQEWSAFRAYCKRGAVRVEKWFFTTFLPACRRTWTAIKMWYTTKCVPYCKRKWAQFKVWWRVEFAPFCKRQWDAFTAWVGRGLTRTGNSISRGIHNLLAPRTRITRTPIATYTINRSPNAKMARLVALAILLFFVAKYFHWHLPKSSSVSATPVQNTTDPRLIDLGLPVDAEGYKSYWMIVSTIEDHMFSWYDTDTLKFSPKRPIHRHFPNAKFAPKIRDNGVEIDAIEYDILSPRDNISQGDGSEHHYDGYCGYMNTFYAYFDPVPGRTLDTVLVQLKVDHTKQPRKTTLIQTGATKQSGNRWQDATPNETVPTTPADKNRWQ